MKPFHPYILVALSIAITAIPSIPDVEDVRDGLPSLLASAIPDGLPWRDGNHVIYAPHRSTTF